MCSAKSKKWISSVHFLYKFGFTHNILSIFFNWPSIIKIISKILWVLFFLILWFFTFYLIPILYYFFLLINMNFHHFEISINFHPFFEYLVQGKKIISILSNIFFNFFFLNLHFSSSLFLHILMKLAVVFRNESCIAVKNLS